MPWQKMNVQRCAPKWRCNCGPLLPSSIPSRNLCSRRSRSRDNSCSPGRSMKQPGAYASQFAHVRGVHRFLNLLLSATEIIAAIVLASDVVVVLCSVVWRYFLHDPVDWAEEVARALMGMQVFLGDATTLSRVQYVGIDSFRAMFPASWRPSLIQLCHWIIVVVAIALLASSCMLIIDSSGQT